MKQRLVVYGPTLVTPSGASINLYDTLTLGLPK